MGLRRALANPLGKKRSVMGKQESEHHQQQNADEENISDYPFF
jgi:hypothetical protein